MPTFRFVFRVVLLVIGAGVAGMGTEAARAEQPTLWLIGDSTVKNGSKDQRGWGEEIGVFFDPAKITVQNRALGGRSSRTFLTEGLWGKVEAEIKPGDFVLMQFGHNDGGDIRKDIGPGRPSRASLKGNGDETEEITVSTTGNLETVHTYGWYLRHYIATAKAKGATPVVLSMVPRNDWKDGKVLRVTEGYGKWASEAAAQGKASFINLNGIVADRYDALGEEKVKDFFPHEHTHTNRDGAAFNARSVVEGIRGLTDVPLRNYLLPDSPTTPGSPTAPATTASAPQRLMENLGRGVVAIQHQPNKVFVSWRLLGDEPEDTAFNVYRVTEGDTAVKLNAAPITQQTHFTDDQPSFAKNSAYLVRAVIDGVEQPAKGFFKFAVNPPVRPYLTLPLKTPTGYTPNDASVGDLDGDGEYEIILHQTGRAHDNSHAGETDPPILQAYKLDGTLLWSINLGKNIREGAHYTQFIVYDLDGDGRAEIACKTADGTTDGKGKVIGSASADHRNSGGYILSGPEFLTIFDGLTGAALATTDYNPPRHPTNPLHPTSDELKKEWGDGYGNRFDRFLACVAYLDGVRPSLVMCRGYYTRTVLAAWNWRDGKLSSVWTFDSKQGPESNRKFGGQGNHNLSVADVDGDGKDEIVYGGMCVDDNGKGLYSTTLGHGDAIHLTDHDPSRPGLEVFRIQERFDDAGAHLFDAKTGEVLWRKPSLSKGGDNEGPGRGLAMDLDPRHPGSECWAAGAGISGLFNCKGEVISEKAPGMCNFAVWWDGDLLRELLDRNQVSKWNWQTSSLDRLLTANECTWNNGTKATPVLSGDILGDWREEVIWRSTDNNALHIYSTTIPTTHRFATLMHDPEYRLSIAWQNVGYNQPPHTSFYLGEGMTKPRRPRITTQLATARSRQPSR
jgi:rhamnogalacturonan endolyase